MAGFFRQLAEQALRPATSLRSAVAAPFAGGQSWAAAADESSPEHAMPAIRADALTNRTRPPSPPTAAVPSDGDAEVPRTRRRSASASPSADDVEMPPAPEPRDERSAVPRHSNRTATAAAMADLPDEPTPSLRRDRTDSRTIPARQAVRQRDPGRILPTGDAHASMKTAGLVPSRGRPAGVPAPAGPNRTQAVTAAAPEVHIHIGRIELSAGTAAPAGAGGRASGAGRKPMSLDAYLQHRRRKSP